MIRTALFDMGNVLVFFSHERMCRQMGELCGLSGPELRAWLIDSGLQWDFERGRLSMEEFHARFAGGVGPADLLPDRLFHAGSSIFVENTSMLPVLAAIKEAGVRLVLLSNTSRPHFDYVRAHFHVLDRFDDFVLSYESDAIKPEPAIFERALSKIGCDPSECFYTDDIPAYIEAGRSHGLDAELFTNTAALLEQLWVRGLKLTQAIHPRPEGSLARSPESTA